MNGRSTLIATQHGWAADVRLDAIAGADLRASVHALLEQGARTIHLRLGSTVRPDAHTWAAIVALSRAARRQGGDLIVHVSSADCGRDVLVSGLDKVLTFRFGTTRRDPLRRSVATAAP